MSSCKHRVQLSVNTGHMLFLFMSFLCFRVVKNAAEKMIKVMIITMNVLWKITQFHLIRPTTFYLLQINSNTNYK